MLRIAPRAVLGLIYLLASLALAACSAETSGEMTPAASAFDTDGTLAAIDDGTLDLNISVTDTSTTPPSFPLTITVIGPGTVSDANGTLVCDVGSAICSGNFPLGGRAVITATPSAGASFTAWGGDCVGTTPLLTLLKTQPRNCTATFVEIDGDN